MKTLNIITPCCRPSNLKFLLESIQASEETKINWYVIYDKEIKPAQNISNLHNSISIIEHAMDVKSVSGNNLRNWALNQITEGFVYFLDDDNIFNPNFWSFFDSFEQNRFYSFLIEFTPAQNIVIRKFENQWHLFTAGTTKDSKRVKITRSGMQTFELAMKSYPELLKTVPLYENHLYPCNPKVDHIDSSMCCVDRNLIGDSRFKETAYNADGIFLEEVFLKSIDNFIYIDEYLGYYNYLNKLNS